MNGSRLRPLVTAGLALGSGFLVLAVGLTVAGYDPGLSLGALWRGAFGSWYALTSATLVRAVPLIVLGLGVALAFRAGALNIGAEGQFYAGAIAATWVGLRLGAQPSWIAIPGVLVAAALAGAMWVALPIWLKLRFSVLEVISTLLLNFVAEALVSLMVQGPLQEHQHIYPQSDSIAATWVGLHVAGWPTPLAIGSVLLSAAVAGVLWIAVPVFLKIRFGVLEVISTLLLNFVAEAAVSYAVTGPLQEARGVYPQSDAIAEVARLPVLGGTRLHIGIVLAIVLALVLRVVFVRTRIGFRLRAVGLGPRAARVSGRIPVTRVLAAALLWSGAFAGLGGGVEISGVSYALFQNLSPGYGFTAIAVALLARLNPVGVLATGLLFGALEAGAQGMQREAGVPAVAVSVVEAVIILVVLLADVLARRRVAAPIADAPADARAS